MSITASRAELLVGKGYENVGEMKNFLVYAPKDEETKLKRPHYLVVDKNTGRLRNIYFEQFSDDEEINAPFLKIDAEVKAYESLF